MNEVLEQLGQTLETATTAKRRIHVFFRNDDVEQDEPAFRRLLDIFARRELPLNLELIPASLTDDTIQLLRHRRATAPDLFELNQHGWQHVNHESAGRKCEFGASRTYDQQLADIARGRKRLDNAFGFDWRPVFTPPWNRCTQDTFRALDALGFTVLSKDQGKQPVTGFAFREVSTTLDLYRWRNGAALKPLGEIADELAAQIRGGDKIGILLHHRVMHEAAFRNLELLIDTLHESTAVRFHTFDSLIHRAGEL